MTSDKIMDVIAKMPGCVGQAADAASAYTQVKMVDAPRMLRIPPKSWSSMEDPVVPLERKVVHGHPLAGLLWERQFEEVFVKTWMGESTELGMPLCLQKTRNILGGQTAMTSKWFGKSRIWHSCRKS